MRHTQPTTRRMQDAQEAMGEAIDLFITYAQVSESTQEGRIARLEKMLQDIATGSWAFSHDFDAWRDAHYAQRNHGAHAELKNMA